jgi:hypothetical protein
MRNLNTPLVCSISTLCSAKNDIRSLGLPTNFNRAAPSFGCCFDWIIPRITANLFPFAFFKTAPSMLGSTSRCATHIVLSPSALHRVSVRADFLRRSRYRQSSMHASGVTHLGTITRSVLTVIHLRQVHIHNRSVLRFTARSPCHRCACHLRVCSSSRPRTRSVSSAFNIYLWYKQQHLCAQSHSTPIRALTSLHGQHIDQSCRDSTHNKCLSPLCRRSSIS